MSSGEVQTNVVMEVSYPFDHTGQLSGGKPVWLGSEHVHTAPRAPQSGFDCTHRGAYAGGDFLTRPTLAQEHEHRPLRQREAIQGSGESALLLLA